MSSDLFDSDYEIFEVRLPDRCPDPFAKRREPVKRFGVRDLSAPPKLTPPALCFKCNGKGYTVSQKRVLDHATSYMAGQMMGVITVPIYRYEQENVKCSRCKGSCVEKSYS